MARSTAVLIGAVVGVSLLVASAVGCSKGEDDADKRTPRRSTTTTTTEPVSPLPTGLGDPMFPELGAPGMDVLHYDVRLTVDKALVASGTVTLTIKATKALSRVAIDARSLKVADVKIDRHTVHWELVEPELLVTPDETIPSGRKFHVEVRYSDDPAPGTPPVRTSPTGELGPGWLRSGDNAVYTINEPEAGRNWLPSLDHPSDKATWRIAIRPPAGMTAIANGLPVSRPKDGRDGEWVWAMRDPMATYLVQVLVGDWTLVESETPDGIALSSALLGRETPELKSFVDGLDEQLAFLVTQFGPYPFDLYGVAVVKDSIGVALEQQGRSLFGSDVTLDYVSVHEMAHQWFGDAVTPARWSDVWLSESFATYAEWLWEQHKGEGTVQSQAEAALLTRATEPGPPTSAPTRDTLFGPNVYEGGAVVVQALRLTIGDADFFTLLRRWIDDNTGTSKRTDDFVALAEEVSGKDLTTWRHDWLDAATLPAHLPS